jgi:mRNA interferase HicA
MNSSRFRRWLSKRGCVFEVKRGTGHLAVRRGDMRSQVPVHGGRKQLGTGLINKILKDLGIEDRPPR